MDFADRLDRLITETKNAGRDLDDMVADLRCAADGLEDEINDDTNDE